ncbi:MAG: toprim domain-containing protein, partial [Magnetococcales bacterium]|nr:toprim domain-containing protein [Magnetococcales bacterium]
PAQETHNQEYALKIWGDSVSGSEKVKEYLSRRGLLSVEALRYHQAKNMMVALVVNGSGQPTGGIHRTSLDPATPKDQKKKMLGPVKGGSVRLGDHLASNSKIAIGEGIETCLAFQQATGIPTWAAMTEGGLRGVEMPDSKPQTVYILADIDEEKMVQGKMRRVGQEAARKAAQLFMEIGIQTFIVWPGDQEGSKIDFNDLLMADATGGSIRTALARAEPVSPDQPPPLDEDWDALLIRSRDGIVPNVANVLTVFRVSAEWRNVFGYNEFAGRVEILSAPPWHNDAWEQQPVQDVHLILTAEWMQHRKINVSPNVCKDGIEAISKAIPFHPVRDFLSGLRWDGIRRIHMWLHDFVGADDTDYTRAVGKKWLIGAVARAFKPGCKMDTVLILEGDQGIGKSTVFKILAGEEWFVDHIPDLGNKDAAIQLQGVWIVEHAELDTLSRGEIGQVKKFISTSSDRFRSPFGKVSTDHPRGCVFAGSVNPGGNGYLKDATGGRRFWPVACGSIDKKGLGYAREQLLAEAVVAFHSGEPWWLSDEEEVLAGVEQAERLERDEWTTLIEGYLHEKQYDFVTITQIMSGCLNIDKEKWTQTDQNRVVKSLKVLGWERYRKRLLGLLIWGYRRVDIVG